ncbi:MAG TPA: hypothetical protein DF712_01940 [Balneola sp.]|nr:hypothetical protein [Balneola sp.]|tara:strand:+ start:217 stop:441 length:225 start_codon:yes stop_codon:yes gene_type:complete
MSPYLILIQTTADPLNAIIDQQEIPRLDLAIDIFNNTDTSTHQCDILKYMGPEYGYMTYASTNGKPLPNPLPGE